MKITGMDEFQITCRELFVEWFNKHRDNHITMGGTFVVWSCKTLQNMKCLCSQNIDGDTTYAEFTYNGDKQELYADFYTKEENVVYR